MSEIAVVGGSVTNPTGPTATITVTAASVGALPTAGGTMSGAVDMGGNAVTNTSGVNGVAITTAGSAGDSLRADGTYKPVALYGSTFIAPTISVVPLTISGPTFLPILNAATPVMPAGTYELQWYSALTASNGGGRAAARVQVDFGGGLAPFSDIIGYRAGDNSGQAIAPSEPLPFTLAVDASITVQIEAQDSGNGTWNNQRTQFQIVRTS